MANQQASPTLHHAIVKSIFSGDTLVIKPLSRSSTNENETRISLNHITAPKLARPPNESNAAGASSVDEPYAFETREFLRKKLVGREICYTIDFQIPQSNRQMCTVYLGKDRETGENIIESLLMEGLVELRPQTGARANDAKYQRLLSIDEQAKSNKRGRYSDQLADVHVRNIKWTLDNPKQFVDEHKSQPPLDAIVEFVRDGNTVRCLLLPSYYFVTIQLTGIKCPMLKREGSSNNENNEPFAEEARQYVDTRLLQRQVKVILDGSNNQNLVGTLLHPNGNIALHLLKEGLAKCVDWSLTLLQPGWREKYRATEKYAKDNRLRIWKNYVAQPGHNDNEKNGTNENLNSANGKSSDPSLKGYQAKVLEVVNGDALTIRDLRDNQIKKIYLSSVRAPRAADLQQKGDDTTARQQIKRPLYEIPYLFEARELLRKRLIGKVVRVVTDYIQPASSEYPEKICCSVYSGNVNIGEALISKGLAKTVRHRQDDENRSSHYDDLLTAEQQAEKRGVGLFSNGTGLQRIVDMTGDANKERVKGLLNVLQRNGRMEGVVEFVASGSRFRVHLLKDNWIVSFILSSINCPRAERRVPVGGNSQQQKIEPAEPFGTEALNFSKEHFLQRDVFVEVENMDRGGNFIGRLSTADGQSAALMLVQAGLAKVHDSAYGTPLYKQLLEAEDKCRKERTGVWTNYEEPTAREEEENENDANAEGGAQDDVTLGSTTTVNFNDSRFRRVVVTYLTNDLKVYVQYSEQGSKVEQLQTDLREYFNQLKPVGGHAPKKGELLAARFTADNEWYRARVEKIEANNRISVYFVDYGNREVVTDLSRLTNLPPGLSQLPAQAHEYELAYVRPPPDEDDREDARNALLDEIANDECLVKVEYRQNNAEYVSLYRASTKENVVKNVAEQGLIVIGQARSGRAVRRTALYDDLLQAQAKAKAARIGLWQYSDQIEDDAAEFGYTGRK